MSSKNRLFGYVVDKKARNGTDLWILRAKFPSEYCELRFEIQSVIDGTKLRVGMSVTFELEKGPRYDSPTRAVNVVPYNPIFGDTRVEERVLERRMFLYPSGATVLCRTFPPSEQHGNWPGNKVSMRQWQICLIDSDQFRHCTPDEILRLEKLLGEWRSPKVAHHPIVGEVSIE